MQISYFFLSAGCGFFFFSWLTTITIVGALLILYAQFGPIGNPPRSLTVFADFHALVTNPTGQGWETQGGRFGPQYHVAVTKATIEMSATTATLTGFARTGLGLVHIAFVGILNILDLPLHFQSLTELGGRRQSVFGHGGGHSSCSATAAAAF